MLYEEEEDVLFSCAPSGARPIENVVNKHLVVSQPVSTYYVDEPVGLEPKLYFDFLFS